MGRTVERLGEFDGGQRILSTNPGLEKAIDVLEVTKANQVNTIMMYYWATQAREALGADLIVGNHFNQPSSVSLRDFHAAEEVIFNELPDADFIDIAPLQPLGTSSHIAGTDQKMIMPALRRSEVNSDATTSLFREAYKRHQETQEDVHLATSARITRVQAFDPKTGFLPHFRMFAQVSVGKSEDNRGPRELDTLASHLESEVRILDALGESPRGDIESLDIKIGNIVFIEDLVARGLIDRTEARRRTQDSSFNMLETAGIKLDVPLRFDDERMVERIKDLGFHKGVSVVERFQETVGETYPRLLPRLSFDLGRVAGIGYYRHLCYKIQATNGSGLTLPLVDGGTTDWARSIDGRNKLVHTVTSGIGIELLAKHFMQQSTE